ncbi:MAG: type I-D CRISPR-associated helicase Cas3' [Kaiparowitsia implicata GSE-PSE-MK54-09C]|jgi:CRISPR-associated endonuclease/helicase Cas3|nr:type I-D CRISPR-associated helicase Cas3' [Kaiparowitsia implicata GSE-PSE-MK54-09C]
MPDYTLKLKPVYSQTVLTPEGVTLPGGWSLSWHQAETFKALSDPNLDVVFNTAMTGDGKSLAAFLRAMSGKTYTLAMYPTNELARDQERQVQDYKEKFQPKYDPQIYRLTGATLENFVEENQLSSKQQGIINSVDNSEILLTNPDIFHYIHQFRYLRRDPKNPRRGDNADKVFRKVDNLYKLFVFDEFHIFSSPQIASVFNAMLLMKHTGYQGKFLFLSATPNELLQGFLMKAGLNCHSVNPVEQGKYIFSSTSNKDWRPISQEINLTFPDDLQPNAKSAYDWMSENAKDIILKFFLDHPGSKGAIILNSIAAVYKLLGKLQPLFKQHNLAVLPNTSLTGDSERARSITDADLLIGTSTIDVGVDFKINFLVFEAADAGNFIQRFGRLGRHQGFSAYQAYALIPNFLVARLFESKDGKAAPLTNGEECDRISFTEAIRKSWSFVNQFEGYPKRWGAIQSFYVWNELRQMKETYPNSDQTFKADIQATLEINVKSQYGVIQRCLEAKQHKIIDEARSFRGSSQLDCAIYDATNLDEPERDKFKTYNLPGLLSNFVFEVIEADEFLAKAQRAGLPKKRFQDALCYLRLTNYREVRENWYFYHSGDLSELARLGKVQILKGIQVTAGANAISKALGRRGIVCYISDHRRGDLRAKLGLPMQFQAYGLSDRPDDRDPPYTIAFGQSALLLETLTWSWKPQEDVGWIC